MERYHMQKADMEVTDTKWMENLLRMGKFVTISMCMDNEPYVVTLSYGYEDGRMYIHTAKEGLKLDIIKENPRVCGTVVEDMGYVHGECSHRYRSVVFWGKMEVVEDIKERMHGMEVLLEHLEDDPAMLRNRFLKSRDAYDRINVLRLDIGAMKGKESLG